MRKCRLTSHRWLSTSWESERKHKATGYSGAETFSLHQYRAGDLAVICWKSANAGTVAVVRECEKKHESFQLALINLAMIRALFWPKCFPMPDPNPSAAPGTPEKLGLCCPLKLYPAGSGTGTSTLFRNNSPRSARLAPRSLRGLSPNHCRPSRHHRVPHESYSCLYVVRLSYHVRYLVHRRSPCQVEVGFTSDPT